LTLNSNARSTCTGCVFCPNVIEDASDDTLTSVNELRNLLKWVCQDHEWPDLRATEVVTVCSGCFYHPAAAIRHMSDLRIAATELGFNGRLHLLSSVIRAREDLARYADSCGPCHLTLTLECFTRRELLLKDTKASLTLDDACRIMDDCADLGIIADFTYVAGLDPLPDAVSGLERLAARCSTFPRIQVFQAHNDYMRRAQESTAAGVDYYLELRNEVEDAFGSRGLRPVSWENYRPLWYTEFAGAPVTGPRV
jgi:hypothetical protein